MREHLLRLAEVQRLDSRAALVSAAIADLDDGSALARKIRGAERKLEQLSEQHRAQQSEQADLEQDLWRLDQKLKLETERLETGQVRDHKGVQELQEHVRSLASRREAAAQKLKQAGVAAAALAAEISELEEKVRRAKKKLTRDQEVYAKEKARLEAELADLAAEREAEIFGLDPALLARYESIRKRAGNRGLVVLEEAVCPACGTAIPGLLYERLLSATGVSTCENCGRILVRPDD